jgi:hypothetical protein
MCDSVYLLYLPTYLRLNVLRYEHRLTVAQARTDTPHTPQGAANSCSK